jgi:cytochrome P450
MRERMGRGLVRAQPWLLRNGDRIFAPLRRLRPVLRIGRAVVLTRHEDVRAVLERDDAFSVTYGEKMEQVTGPFILGWDDGPRYRAEAGALHAALRPGDAERLAVLTREAAARALADPGLEPDAVALADEVTGAGLERLFGLPEVAPREQRDRARAVFRAVFLDGETPAVLEEGRRASAELVRGLEAAMRRVREDGEAEETLLGRLLAAQGDGSGTALSDEAIPRNLVGLVAAWSASVPRAFSLAFDVLLSHPADLERARRAAAGGDEDAVAGLLLDALRLQPQAPFLARRCRGEVVVAPGAAREHRVRQGDVVIAVTSSAMRDRHVLEAPGALRPDRPESEYLHFGAGLHRCFGAVISRTQFGALGAQLLTRPGLARAGRLRWGPAFPAALPLLTSSSRRG